jgi:FkbM family methyltransferase
MNIIQKILLKLSIEWKFQLQQKYGILAVRDKSNIAKYKLLKYLPKNPTIVDCGAHIGSDSVEWARLLPHAKIYSFEPVPGIYESLKYNTRKLSNISTFPYALSDKTGITDLYVSSGTSDASSSLLEPTGHKINHPTVSFNERIKVKSYTLDDWAKNINLNQIDLLWLDMQGYEFRMLEKSPIILKTVKAIYSEVSVLETYDGAVQYNDFKNWLNKNGFKETIEAIPENTDMGNVLFIKNEK